MDAAAVLDDLQALGVTLTVQGDKLRFWPRAAVGPEVLEEMRLHKAELVALLTAPEVTAEVVVDGHHDDDARPGHHDDDGALPRGHRLIGVEYPLRPTERPDPRIIADPVTMCSCGGARLLPELQGITGGRCWKCWTENPGHAGQNFRPGLQRINLQAARKGAAERFRQIAKAMLDEAGVKTVWLFETALRGKAWAKEKRVSIPPPTTRRRLMVAAHEAGHVAHGHCGKLPMHREEYEAEMYAHDAMRRHGVAVPRKSTDSGKRYVAWKIHQAIVRGAKSIDSEALAWCRDHWTVQTLSWVERQKEPK